MEKLHSEALVAKEEEMSARIDKAVVCPPGYSNSPEFKTQVIEESFDTLMGYILIAILDVILSSIGTVQRGVCPVR